MFDFVQLFAIIIKGLRMAEDRIVAFQGAVKKALSILEPTFCISYANAPASASHHQNYEGGLLEHCYIMGLWLYSRSVECGGPIDLTIDECARIALYHDLCKVGLYTRGKDGIWYCDSEMYEHHALLSVQRCEELGIILSQKERICILLHMAGAWWKAEDEEALTAGDRKWLANHFGIVSAVQWADMKAC